VRKLVETVEKVSKEHLLSTYRRIQPSTDIAAQYPNQPVCKEPIFLGIRNDLQ